jgi:hypothetical protein
MKKLAILASVTALAALSAGSANAHPQYVSPTGWSCSSPGQFVPYGDGYHLYCGTDRKWYLVHAAH